MVWPGADSDPKHLLLDVQDIDVTQPALNLTFLLMTQIRKKAEALDQVKGRFLRGGMTALMKDWAKDILVGHTGETNDDNDDNNNND